MKHQMNKISGYYEGPDGIFYDYKHDEIFELIHSGAEIARVIKRKAVIVGRLYHRNPQPPMSRKPVAIKGLRYCIRLGEA